MPWAIACLTDPGLDRLAVLVEVAADVVAVGASEDAHRQLGAARTHQAGDADHLARADEEVGVVDDQPTVLQRMVDGPVLDPQHLLADVGRALGVAALQVAADHPADDPLLGDVVGVQVEGLDRLPVADDRDPVGDGFDLVQLVADDDRGDPVVAQTRDQAEQVGGVLVVQRGGRLVQDQQLDVLGQRLGDLDQLLLAHPDVGDLGDRVLAPDRPGSAARPPSGWWRSSRSARRAAARCRGRCSPRSTGTG